MQSPVCPNASLKLKDLEPGLKAYECLVSGGIWIPLQAYLDWKEFHQHEAVPLPPDYVPEFEDDSHQPARVCPESGRLLLRYRVGHGLHFRIDVSPATGGVWLDKGEWEALKSKDLHAQLNLIFTASYQHDLRKTELTQRIDEVFRQRIGPIDFAKVLKFKNWLEKHPQREDIQRYLSQE